MPRHALFDSICNKNIHFYFITTARLDDSTSPSQTSPTLASYQGDPEMQMRQELANFFKKVLNKLLRFTCAVRSLLKNEMLTLLFGAVSSPCAYYNKIWQKCAAHTLIAICRYAALALRVELFQLNNQIVCEVYRLPSANILLAPSRILCRNLIEWYKEFLPRYHVLSVYLTL